MIRAAQSLFLAKGYSATTLLEVAEKAGVAEPTVYAVFGSKRQLLLAVFEAARHEYEGSEADLDAIIESGAPLDAEVIAHRVRVTREGGAPVARIVAQAAAADRELATLWREIQDARHARMRTLTRALAEQGRLGPALDEDAAVDAVWALTSNEVYGLLVLDRGWTPAAYEQWLAHAIAGALLA